MEAANFEGWRCHFLPRAIYGYADYEVAGALRGIRPASIESKRSKDLFVKNFDSSVGYEK